MKLSKLRTALLAAALGLCCGSASAQDALDASRGKFMQAYNAQRYDHLCDLLHKDASFRGKLYPTQWTHTADKIIMERWRSARSCTEIKQGAAVERQTVDIFTVGQSDITITPSSPASILSNNSYALDTGHFVMAPKRGSTRPVEQGSYVMLWIRESDEWKLMHIDMASGP